MRHKVTLLHHTLTQGHWGSTSQACAYYTSFGYPITMAYEESAQVEYTANLGSGDYAYLEFNGGCVQGFADAPYNGGWTVALESCADLSGQRWKSEYGPVVNGLQTYYWVNEWNPAYCLAWDQSAGTLFANTCRNAWYQQLESAYGPTNSPIQG